MAGNMELTETILNTSKESQVTTSEAESAAQRYRCAIDTLSPTEWNAALATFADASIHSTREFGVLRWGPEKLSQIVLYDNDEIVAMAQVIIVAMPALGTGIAHCKFGPVWRRMGRAENIDVYREILLAMRAEYVDRQGLLLRIKPWELDDTDNQLGDARESAGLQAQPDMPRYHTFVLDMSRSIDELRAGFNQKWRYNLKKAEKHPLEIVQATGPEQADVYMQLYAEMRDLKSYVDTSEVDMLPGLSDTLTAAIKPTIFVAYSEGVPAASIVISMVGNTAYYLFGATGNAGRNGGASYVLFWQAMIWLKEQDCRWFDLVGSQPHGTGGDVGYRRFKSGMTGKNGAEYHMQDWELSGSWKSYLVVHGGSYLRDKLRAVRHGLNGFKERLKKTAT